MNQSLSWRYLPLGEAALLVEALPSGVLANRYALALDALLADAQMPGILATVPAINSLLITFDPLQLSLDALQARVEAMLVRAAPAPEQPERVVRVPVRYGGADGPDLEDVAATRGLSPAQVVALHCGQVYRVMMVGFAPGFPYLGPLPDALDVPRRATPRTAVPEGSVAIAAGLTGIYPARLPGGWHLIGRTALRLFDPDADPPVPIAPGDGVRFEPLDGGVMP